MPNPSAMVSNPVINRRRARVGVVAKRGSHTAPKAAAIQGSEVSNPTLMVLNSPYLLMMLGRKKITV